MADVGAWSWDIQDDVWSFSENWLKIHGCSEPPRTTEDLLPIAHPEDQSKIREAFRNSLAEKTRYDIRHRIVRQDNGEIRHIQGLGDVETNTAGEPVRMFGASMDVTRQRRNQQALEQARAAAERANRAKSDFLAMMSHEIRTPMNSILGMLRLALSGDLPGKQKERIQVARDSAESLLWLLNDILDLSRVEAGRFTLNEKEFRIRHLLNNICREIEVQASEKNIKHYLSVGQDLPTVLHGDPYRLKRILYNLLSNAIKFTDRGWVSLEAERVDTRPGPEDDGFMITTVLFTIKDTGKGIDPDKLESIFDSYYQAVHDSLSPEQGAGLGLAICKNLSKLMGGSIWAESEPGQGSLFYVQLPFKTDGQIMEEPESVNDDANWPDSSPLNILLVEDQKMNQIFTVDLLSSYGHQITVAENGQEALDTLARSSFDLVLMDIKMPVMDGIETTMRIRTADPLLMNPDIPVIGISAHTVTDQEMQRFQYAGFSSYVVKPVNFEKLFTAIEEVLKKDQQE
jgi:signal transduction histidine kinase/ActR/RegA family two-component response regulator